MNEKCVKAAGAIFFFVLVIISMLIYLTLSLSLGLSDQYAKIYMFAVKCSDFCTIHACFTQTHVCNNLTKMKTFQIYLFTFCLTPLCSSVGAFITHLSLQCNRFVFTLLINSFSVHTHSI